MYYYSVININSTNVFVRISFMRLKCSVNKSSRLAHSAVDTGLVTSDARLYVFKLDDAYDKKFRCSLRVFRPKSNGL